MKLIEEVIFGFSDAENYRRRENKDLFDKIFLKTSAIEDIKKSSTFFLIGEKGTGKTAYAVYFASTPRDKFKSIHRYIRETDYQKFIWLKRNKKIGLSEYTDIWKVIIYLLIVDSIYKSVGTAQFLLQFPKFKALKAAIDDYYKGAFSPEIPMALQLVEHSSVAAEIIAKHAITSANLKASDENTITKTSETFQTSLLRIEKSFQEALSSLKLTDHHLLFVDGIDIRPTSVPYNQYIDCVKGLANALWSVNNDFFPSIKDSPGRLRVIGLLRPDIFNSLGLQNRNTKLRDNSSILNWKVVYYKHRTSELFKMADRMFSSQQDHVQSLGACWDHYFPFKTGNVRTGDEEITSFVLLLRNSWHRPRDILSILDIVRSLHDPSVDGQAFQYSSFVSAEFKRRNGDYLLGEVRDSLSFYYSEADFEQFLKFFEYLDGVRKFSYEKYQTAFQKFQKWLGTQGDANTSLKKTADEFLQILYEQNIISYFEQTEDELFVRWCFLERSPSNLAPKVKIGMDYEIHYGLANVLNIGKELIQPRRGIKRNLTKPQLDKNPSATKSSR